MDSKKIILDQQEKAILMACVKGVIETYIDEKKTGIHSEKTATDRIMDGLNGILADRCEPISRTRRLHPEDVGDPPGFVHITVDDL
jgi:hypothetical protein